MPTQWGVWARRVAMLKKKADPGRWEPTGRDLSFCHELKRSEDNPTASESAKASSIAVPGSEPWREG